MLELTDFLTLPSLQPHIQRLTAGRPGLRLVAGLDPQDQPDPVASIPGDLTTLLPSGRATIFRILARHMLDQHPRGRAVVIAQHKDAVRVPRQLRRRLELLVIPPREQPAQIAAAAARRPALIVIESLPNAAIAEAALRAARANPVLTQIDTVFHGAAVLHDLCDLGLNVSALETLQWIVSVRRLPMLCPHCKQPMASLPDPAIPDAKLHTSAPSPSTLSPLILALQRRYPHLKAELQNTTAESMLYQAPGCQHCDHSGRQGHVAAFDIFHNQGYETSGLPYQPSLLPLEAYVLQLIQAGYLTLDDLLHLEAGDLRRAYTFLRQQQSALHEINRTLQAKSVELDAANNVLRHRTEALISLQEVSQALIAGDDLRSLAQRITRHTAALCGADRAVLYVLQDGDTAAVLASHGWDLDRVPATVPAALLELPAAHQAPGAVQGGGIPVPYDKWPPGIDPRPADVEGVYLYAGLRLPLLAQEEPVGLLVVHATRQHSFAPGDVSLLHSFANQAALALQRAGLIDQLRAKISALEAAQAGLAQKERMEKELELARQVQQSVLPRTVPHIPGFRFAMRNEPARQVGGDFYDVVALDDADGGAFAIAIADVSDKGMPAALYMALSRSLLLCEARLSRSPFDVICSVNELLLELGRPNMFVTVFFGLVNRRTRELRYVRAGHDYPILLRGDEIRELHGRGMALGLMPTRADFYSEETITLQPGDRLVLYTDGLSDVLSPDQQFYSRERLGRLLQRHAALPLDRLCPTVFADLHAYRATAPQFDDMTMLVVEVDPV